MEELFSPAKALELAARLSSSSEEERFSAIRELKKFPKLDTKSFSAVLKASGDESERVADEAEQMVFKHAGSHFSVIRNALSHENEKIRGTAAEYMVKEGKWVARLLAKLLKDPSEEVRYRAVCGLLNSWSDAGDAVPDLVRLITDPSPRINLVALQVLSEHKRRALVEVVTALKQHAIGQGHAAQILYALKDSMPSIDKGVVKVPVGRGLRRAAVIPRAMRT